MDLSRSSTINTLQDDALRFGFKDFISNRDTLYHSHLDQRQHQILLSFTPQETKH
jgi:hypothetical protein